MRPPTTKHLALFRTYIGYGSLPLAVKETGLNANSISYLLKNVARFLLKYNRETAEDIKRMTHHIKSIYAYDILLLKLADSYEKHLSKKKPIRTLDALTVDDFLYEIREAATEITNAYFLGDAFILRLEGVIRKAVAEGIRDAKASTRLAIHRKRKQDYESKIKKSAMVASLNVPYEAWVDNAIGSSGLDEISEKDNATGSKD